MMIPTDLVHTLAVMAATLKAGDMARGTAPHDSHYVREAVQLYEEMQVQVSCGMLNGIAFR